MAAKVQKVAREEMRTHLMATFTCRAGAGVAPGPLTPGNATAAGEAIAGAAGSPAAAAAIQAAIAGQ